jgi:hypothetical protein
MLTWLVERPIKSSVTIAVGLALAVLVTFAVMWAMNP